MTKNGGVTANKRKWKVLVETWRCRLGAGMKSLATLLLFLSLLVFTNAGDIKMEAVIAVDGDTKPAESFAADTPQLVAFFRSTGSVKGDKIHAVLTAVDVGEAAPANTKVMEDTLAADKDNFFGGFTFSKPTAGWPAGKYKVEFFVGDELLATAKFTITPAK
jgi:hypothetical protein